jgi:hypothetical protein
MSSRLSEMFHVQSTKRPRDVAREIAKTEAYVSSRRERKKIEMLFAHLKRILRLDRLRLRGPLGARDEFLVCTENRIRVDDVMESPKLAE